jgi:uncharacterized membrane-anchored protein
METYVGHEWESYMSLHSVLNGNAIPNRTRAAGAAPAAAEPNHDLSNTPPQVGTFSTAQSLFSFSGATTVVTAIWQAIARAYPDFNVFGLSTLVLLCAVAGLIIWLYNITDPNVTPKPTVRDKFFALILAAVNTFQLYCACIGAKAIIVG